MFGIRRRIDIPTFDKAQDNTPVYVNLKPGSLFLMAGAVQEKYVHELPLPQNNN